MLPLPILVKRVNNELAACSDYLNSKITRIPEDFSDFPVSIDIMLRNVPGFEMAGDNVIQRNEHMCRLILSKEYGHRKPEVRWLTPIFHPNIMMPDDGGYVCVKTADTWTFGSTLLSFIKSIEHLVTYPNPKSPFGTESCMNASAYCEEHESKIEISINLGGRKCPQ